MSNFKPTFAVFCVLLAVVPQVLAHDLYILPGSFRVHRGDHLRVAFHNGDSFPASEVAPNPLRLHDAKVTGLQSSEKIVDLRMDGLETLGDVQITGAGGLQISVTTEPNLIALPADKFLAYLKEEGLDDVIAERKRRGEAGITGRERYSKYAKALLQSDGVSDAYSKQPLGLPIEIVPVNDPYGMTVGSKLPVVVLLHGKPIAGIQVEAAWASGGKGETKVIGKTDGRGRIEIPIDQAGIWRLHSLHMERYSDNKVADWESLWASLTYEVR